MSTIEALRCGSVCRTELSIQQGPTQQGLYNHANLVDAVFFMGLFGSVIETGLFRPMVRDIN